MINKIKSLSKKQWLMIVGALLLVVALVVTICLICNSPEEGEIKLESIKDIEITVDDMREYRERIGRDMDIKKSYLILFEDEVSCRSFIESHGEDQNPTAVGIGIIPMMENGYYNIVGKQTLEDAFDLLADGEYSKEPIIYSNMFCYLKRIGIDSPVNDDEALKELIRNERYQEIKKVGD